MAGLAIRAVALFREMLRAQWLPQVVTRYNLK